MAARLRRDLQADVRLVRGRFGEFKVLVDGYMVINGDSGGFFGELPSEEKVLDAVKERLKRG